jgi:hypothetical protein
MGRWINRDPIGYDGGINLYGYCVNNPISNSDSNGTWCVPAWLVWVGGVTGGVAAATLVWVAADGCIGVWHIKEAYHASHNMAPPADPNNVMHNRNSGMIDNDPEKALDKMCRYGRF